MIAAFKAAPGDAVHRKGAYWGIASDVRHYPLRDHLRVPHTWSAPLANVPTRLAAVPERLQERLINWGYAVADTALRAHLFNRVWNRVARPKRVPYPEEAPTDSSAHAR